ncbi:DUF4838 domain-containing protein [Candidatus Poribacteria bacterium]|nr:DUF4838 domain-containing protein [Candidatus Poribacteria bacterium]
MSQSVTLVRDGEPAAVILTDPAPTPSARLAAMELQYHVERMTGARLAITADAASAPGIVRLLVGESERTRQLGLRSSDFASQEYAIRFTGDEVVLIGRDWQDTPENRAEVGRGTNFMTLQDARHRIDYLAATGGSPKSNGDRVSIELPGLFDDQGTAYAVYDFLERFCGVRWYGPSTLNVVVPRAQTLTVEGEDVRRAPAMSYREGIGGGWPILQGQWGNPNGDQLALYWRRMRVGGERWGANHSFRSFYDRFLKQNPDNPHLFEGERPDYFAQGWTQGERQFCYTNAALVEQVAHDARDYFDGRGLKGYQVAMGDYFAVVPMDNANWCKCDRCQAWLERDRDNIRGSHFSSGTATHYLFQFVNAVAREVGKTHPSKWIATLAYHVYAFRPTDFELEPNVAVAPCLQNRNYWAPLIRKNDIDLYKAWVEPRDRPIHLWNYYCFPMEPALISGWKCFPGFNIRGHAAQIRMYHEDGVRGVFLCGIGEQVDYYVTMRLYHDATLDVEATLDEFFRLYFGRAAEPMKRFYDLIERRFADPSNYPDPIRQVETQYHQTAELAWKYLGTDGVMSELGRRIDEAEGLATDPLERERVASWRSAVWDYMVAGKAEYGSKSGG